MSHTASVDIGGFPFRSTYKVIMRAEHRHRGSGDEATEIIGYTGGCDRFDGNLAAEGGLEELLEVEAERQHLGIPLGAVVHSGQTTEVGFVAEEQRQLSIVIHQDAASDRSRQRPGPC